MNTYSTCLSLNDLVYFAKRENTSGIVTSRGLLVGAYVTERGDPLTRVKSLGRGCIMAATTASRFCGDNGWFVGVVVMERLWVGSYTDSLRW